MMKLSTRYGDMFSCGWLPPTDVTPVGLIAVFPVVLYRLGLEHQRFPEAPGVGGLLEDPTGTWLCAGVSEMLSVCVLSPPFCPRVKPPPMWTGERPCKSGSAKVVSPFPP